MPSPPAPAPYTIHVYVLGSYFLSIRNAYASCSGEIAHGVVERQIEKVGAKANMVLYIDGEPSDEKGPTIAKREKERQEALTSTVDKLQVLEQRVNDGLRLRKRHFTDVAKSLRSAFYWGTDARQAFGTHMLERGWVVVFCPTEADLSIGQACQPTDIVLSRDSDMIYYANIRTHESVLWGLCAGGEGHKSNYRERHIRKAYDGIHKHGNVTRSCEVDCSKQKEYGTGVEYVRYHTKLPKSFFKNGPWLHFSWESPRKKKAVSSLPMYSWLHALLKK